MARRVRAARCALKSGRASSMTSVRATSVLSICRAWPRNLKSINIAGPVRIPRSGRSAAGHPQNDASAVQALPEAVRRQIQSRPVAIRLPAVCWEEWRGLGRKTERETGPCCTRKSDDTSSLTDAQAPRSRRYQMPPFSWETLPVSFHSCNSSGSYTDEQIKILAKYGSIGIEKSQELNNLLAPGSAGRLAKRAHRART